jgi:hypothetical protein
MIAIRPPPSYWTANKADELVVWARCFNSLVLDVFCSIDTRYGIAQRVIRNLNRRGCYMFRDTCD